MTMMKGMEMEKKTKTIKKKNNRCFSTPLFYNTKNCVWHVTHIYLFFIFIVKKLINVIVVSLFLKLFLIYNNTKQLTLNIVFVFLNIKYLTVYVLFARFATTWHRSVDDHLLNQQHLDKVFPFFCCGRDPDRKADIFSTVEVIVPEGICLDREKWVGF